MYAVVDSFASIGSSFRRLHIRLGTRAWLAMGMIAGPVAKFHLDRNDTLAKGPKCGSGGGGGGGKGGSAGSGAGSSGADKGGAVADRDVEEREHEQCHDAHHRGCGERPSGLGERQVISSTRS